VKANRQNSGDRNAASVQRVVHSAESVVNRRELLEAASGAALVTAGIATARGQEASAGASSSHADYKVAHQNIQQSVVHWCFRPMTVEQLAAAAVRMGLKSVELISPSDWPVLKKHNLICAISGSHGFAKGFAHKEEHAECLASLEKSIDATSEAGYPSVITFSGFRRGIDIDEGQKNMVAGLKQIVGRAENSISITCRSCKAT
jgi:hydroxypyruvate isomerase